MTLDTKALRSLAEKATQGEWFVSENDGSICAEPRAGEHVEVGPVDFDSADFAFVVAANPQTVIALLDEVERLRRELAEARQREAVLEEYASPEGFLR